MAEVAEGQAELNQQIVAAGCLVTREVDGQQEVLLVHRPKYNDWSLPKGKRDADEHILLTAVREVLEETGIRVRLQQPLPHREYTFAGHPKVVYYWRAAVVVDKGFVPSREVDQIRWLGADAAKNIATHPLDKELITLATDPGSTPFVVLRHAHAVKRSAWSGDDSERPLDPAGVLQSDELARRLRAFGVHRVHTSPARRCVQSVTPYAEAAGVPLITEPALTETTYPDSPREGNERAAGLLADAVRSGEPTVLCGHRPHLPDLIDYLVDGTGLVGPHDTVPVGSMIVLHASSATSGNPIIALEHHLL